MSAANDTRYLQVKPEAKCPACGLAVFGDSFTITEHEWKYFHGFVEVAGDEDLSVDHVDKKSGKACVAHFKVQELIVARKAAYVAGAGDEACAGLGAFRRALDSWILSRAATQPNADAETGVGLASAYSK